MMLMVSCGYTLELKRIGDPEKEDPIMVIRRDIRKMKADHRVAIFDLRKEHADEISSIRMNVGRIGKANEGLGQAAIQSKQKAADIDERFSEIEIQRRLIHGRIDEEANRNKEAVSRINLFTLKELELLRKELLEHGTKSKMLQKQIDRVQAENTRLKQSEIDQQKTVQAVSDQVSQLVEKVLPAVNGLASRLDDLEWQVKKLGEQIDVQGLNKRLSDLTEAIDVQRQSLEMLGNTLTSQVDKQQSLLKTTNKRIKRLEAGKPSEDPKAQ